MFLFLDLTENKFPEINEQLLNSESLLIGDIYILSPHKTVIPFYALNNIIPELISVVEDIRFNITTNSLPQNIDLYNAFTMAIRLIGFDFSSKHSRQFILDKFTNKFSLDWGFRKREFDTMKISNFLTDYLVISKKYKVSSIPLNSLLNYNPGFIFHDSTVQIALSLLRYLCYKEKVKYSKRAIEILDHIGFSGFIKKYKVDKASGYRPLKQFRLFKNNPEQLYLLVKLYGLIIEDIFKKNDQQFKSTNIDKELKIVYEEIYRTEISDNLLNKFKDNEDKILDKTHIALHLLAYEFKETDDDKTHYEGLKDYYLEISKSYKNSPQSFLPIYFDRILRSKPNLRPWIDKLKSQYNS